eukprot:12760029-Ditylum_brightwellii.AAC.1
MAYGMSSIAGSTTKSGLASTQTQSPQNYTPEEEEHIYILLEAYPEYSYFIYCLTTHRRLPALIHCMIQDLNATPAIHINS